MWCAVVLFSVACMVLGLLYSLLSRQYLWAEAVLVRFSCLGAGALLVAPITDPLNRWLHSLTGLWNLEDLIGYLLLIIGLAMNVFIVLTFLGDDLTLQIKVHQVIQFPLTVGVPLMVAFFLKSQDAVSQYRSDIFVVDGGVDFCLAGFWVIWGALLFHLLAAVMRALISIRRYWAYRLLATAALVACVIGAIGAFSDLMAALNPRWGFHPFAIFVGVLALVVGGSMELGVDFFVVRRVLAAQKSWEPT